jgi:hypothetical protein
LIGAAAEQANAPLLEISLQLYVVPCKMLLPAKHTLLPNLQPKWLISVHFYPYRLIVLSRKLR